MSNSTEQPFRVRSFETPRWKFDCTARQDDECMGLEAVIRPWREDEIIGRLHSVDRPLPSDVFICQIRYKSILSLYESLQVYENPIWSEELAPLTTDWCWIKRSSVVRDEEHDSRIISNFLTDFLLNLNTNLAPFVDEMVQEIADFGRDLASMPRNVGREGLSFDFDILGNFRYTYGEFESNIRDVLISIVGSISEDFTPASELAIKSLARGKLEAKVDEKCLICLEGLEEGQEVIWMPCTHIYHEQCILKWLETKNACPLCRHLVLSPGMDANRHESGQI